MSEEKDPVERQQHIEAIHAQYSAHDGNARPSFGARLFAILLLIFVTPFLLFTGYCGLAASVTPIGPIVLAVFGVGAFIAYKGVRALWMAHDSEAGMGWAIAFVVFAIATACLYIWAGQPLGWHN